MKTVAEHEHEESAQSYFQYRLNVTGRKENLIDILPRSQENKRKLLIAAVKPHAILPEVAHKELKK